MSKQDVEVLCRLYEAFNGRDMPAMLDCFDAAAEIEETSDLDYAALLLRVLGPRFVVLSGGYRGREEIRSLFETVWAISEWFIVEPEEFIEHGDTVLVPLMLRAKSLDSGAEGEADTVHLWNMSGGKATRLRVFADRTRALEAAWA
jgi:ketosteroid isomerase-like protein